MLQGTQASSPSTVSPAQQTPPGANIDESHLKRRTEPVGCLQAERIELDGVLLEVDRVHVAIEALGKCQVTVKNSRIVARTAVLGGGESSITFENCIIDGAIRLMQKSVASIRSSTIHGKGQKLQFGKIKDLGQNVWQ